MKFDDKLQKAVLSDIKHNKTPMLVGEPGIGKSSWMEDLTRNILRTECFTLAANQLADKSDVTGCRTIPVDGHPGEYTQVFFPHQVVTDLINYAKDHPTETPVLFIDEINRTGADVTSALLSLTTLRRIGSKVLPDNVRIVTAGNDKGNVTALDMASVSRFSLYKVVPDVQTFFAVNPDLHPMIKKVLTEHPSDIFCTKMHEVLKDEDGKPIEASLEDLNEYGNESMSQITTPRTITCLSEWLSEFSDQDIRDWIMNVYMDGDDTMNILQEAIESHVGKTAFTTHLMAEIGQSIISTQNQGNTTMIGKPAAYDQLKACQSMSEIQQIAASMDDQTKSSCLLYALYEHADNRSIISGLAPMMTALTPGDTTQLMSLTVQGQMDAENVHALLATPAPIVAGLQTILNTIA